MQEKALEFRRGVPILFSRNSPAAARSRRTQAEEMCQEIVKPFRELRLIDRLNGVIGELASVCDVMRNNCQREQIQQETENQCRQNPERAVDASQKIAAYGIGSPAPDCKEHCKIQLADGIELFDRRKIEPFTEQENRRKGKIDHPRPRIAADQGAGKSGVRLISRLGQNLLYHVLQFVLVIHNQNAIGHTGPPFLFSPSL